MAETLPWWNIGRFIALSWRGGVFYIPNPHGGGGTKHHKVSATFAFEGVLPKSGPQYTCSTFFNILFHMFFTINLFIVFMIITISISCSIIINIYRSTLSHLQMYTDAYRGRFVDLGENTYTKNTYTYTYTSWVFSIFYSFHLGLT